jgi:GntR family transcriptional regulator, transcriptional repressor for pyruvate dehydrogenase complex
VSPQDSPALSPLPRRPLYELLAERLRAHVLETGLRPGDRLPGERDLAAQLGVSRASVRQATVALEVQGLIEVRHGCGTFLRVADVEALPMGQMLDRKRRLPDILDAREALEVKLAELAAQRRTGEDLAAMRDALAFMADEIASGGIGERGDALFHRAVADSARAALIVEMYGMLGEDIAVSRRESLSQVGRPEASHAQHGRIIATIEQGDPAAAAEAMRVHLRAVRDVKLLGWSPEAS